VSPGVGAGCWGGGRRHVENGYGDQEAATTLVFLLGVALDRAHDAAAAVEAAGASSGGVGHVSALAVVAAGEAADAASGGSDGDADAGGTDPLPARTRDAIAVMRRALEGARAVLDDDDDNRDDDCSDGASGGATSDGADAGAGGDGAAAAASEVVAS